MARPLPKKGFYVWSVDKFAAAMKLTDEQKARVVAGSAGSPNVVYCSGTTKGNYYYNPAHHGDQWNFLTWTCVPSVKDAAAQYDYHEENPVDKPLP